MKVKEIIYDRDHTKLIRVKYQDLGATLVPAPIFHSSIDYNIQLLRNWELGAAYESKLHLSEKQKHDLMTMVTKDFIPSHYKDYCEFEIIDI